MTRNSSPPQSKSRRFSILAIAAWIAFLAYVFTIPPSTNLHQILFFIILFMAIFSTIATLISNFRLVFFISTFLTILLAFQVANQLTFLNIALLLGLSVALYFLVSR